MSVNLKAAQFVSVMLVALSMSLAVCHLFEMPVRLEYSPALWITVTNVAETYRFFGPPIGAALEGGAWLSAVVLAVVSRKHGPAVFRLAALGAALAVAAQIVWWSFVFPVNTQMAGWVPDAVPAGFADLRAQWEVAHAVRALLQIGTLAALVASALLHRDPPSMGR